MNLKNKPWRKKVAIIKPKKGKSKKYVTDSMVTEQSDTKFRKKSLQDKMNRAPEYNKGIAKGKRDNNYSTEI